MSRLNFCGTFFVSAHQKSQRSQWKIWLFLPHLPIASLDDRVTTFFLRKKREIATITFFFAPSWRLDFFSAHTLASNKKTKITFQITKSQKEQNGLMAEFSKKWNLFLRPKSISRMRIFPHFALEGGWAEEKYPGFVSFRSSDVELFRPKKGNYLCSPS